MANTAANRMAGGFKVFMAVQSDTPGTPALPALTGTAITWGTDWPQMPSASEDVAVSPNFKFEDFMPPEYLTKTDVDLVEDGVSDIQLKIKETDIDALKLFLGTGLYGTVAAGTGTAAYDTLLQPHAGTDFPLYQAVLQLTGPQGGWGQLIWFPRVKRVTPPLPMPSKGKVRTLAINLAVLAVESATLIPEGTTYKIFEYKSAPLE